MIVLAGMIGAGKSTYTGVLADHFQTEAFYEEVDNNPILDQFYENPKRWAFPLQIFFLNTRFKAIKEALTNANNVLDRSIYEDALFTYVNYKQGNISEIEFQLYLNLLDNMMEELKGMPKKAPDLLIYLDGSFETILAHIKKRGRDYEQVDNDPELLDYYRSLYDHYRGWYDAYDKSPKMCINIDKYDILEDPEPVLELIDQKLKEVRE